MIKFFKKIYLPLIIVAIFIFFLFVYSNIKKDYIVLECKNKIGLDKLQSNDDYVLSYKIEYKKKVKIQGEEIVESIAFTNNDLFEIQKINIIDGRVDVGKDFAIIPYSLYSKYFEKDISPIGSEIEIDEKTYIISGLYKDSFLERNAPIYLSNIEDIREEVYVKEIYLKISDDKSLQSDEIDNVINFLELNKESVVVKFILY